MHSAETGLADPSAAMGLLWARRGLRYWQSVFRSVLEGRSGLNESAWTGSAGDEGARSGGVASGYRDAMAAYEETIGPFNGWGARACCCVHLPGAASAYWSLLPCLPSRCLAGCCWLPTASLVGPTDRVSAPNQRVCRSDPQHVHCRGPGDARLVCDRPKACAFPQGAPGGHGGVDDGAGECARPNGGHAPPARPGGPSQELVTLGVDGLGTQSRHRTAGLAARGRAIVSVLLAHLHLGGQAIVSLLLARGTSEPGGKSCHGTCGSCASTKRGPRQRGHTNAPHDKHTCGDGVAGK